jgi:hypothetical protein
MTTTITSTTEARRLLGCPTWCNFDHLGDVYMEPGDHTRALAQLGREGGDSVGLYIGPDQPLHVMVCLGRNGSEEYHATRETVEELRDLAGMFKAAADELSGLLHSGELEAQR